MMKKFFLPLAVTAVLQVNIASAATAETDYLKQSQAAIQEGRVYAAIELLQKAESQSAQPKQRQLISLALVDALLRNGQIAAAEHRLENVYQELTNAHNPALLGEAMQRFGHIAVALKDRQQAIDWYRKAVAQVKQTADQAQIAAALLNLASVDANHALLTEANRHIQSIDDLKLQQQLRVSLAYRAAQQGRVQMAYQALQNVLQQSPVPRLKSQVLGQLAELYQQQNRINEALQLTDQALLADSSPDLQLQWHWQRARLLAMQQQTEPALAAYRSAAQQLQQLRVDIPAIYHNGESSFNQTFAPLYTDFIAMLLKQAKQKEGARQQQLLAEAVHAWEQLKAVELQDYFRDACAVKQQQQQAVLEAGTAMLYPMLLSDGVAMVVRFADQIKAYPVSQTPAQIRLSTQRLNQAVYGFESVLEKSQALYQALIAPIAADLQQKNIQTLVYLPDGPLRTVPFALLHDGQRYLTEKYALVTVPGLSMLAERSTELSKKDILLAGMSEPGPVVEELVDSGINILGAPEEQRGLQLRGENISFGAPAPLTERNLRVSRLKQELALPGVKEELKTLASISQVKVMENADFMLNNFQQSVQQGHAFVHIASHGYFSGEPEKSFIMTYDHLLTMRQLSELFQTEAFHDRPIELVTLSACQTAEGDDRSPLGLSGVVVQTGVKSAIGTLWPVADEAAKRFFADFYQYYQQPGTTKAQAMQYAQKKLLQDEQMNHPIFWAPFVLVGEWH